MFLYCIWSSIFLFQNNRFQYIFLFFFSRSDRTKKRKKRCDSNDVSDSQSQPILETWQGQWEGWPIRGENAPTMNNRFNWWNDFERVRRGKKLKTERPRREALDTFLRYTWVTGQICTFYSAVRFQLFHFEFPCSTQNFNKKCSLSITDFWKDSLIYFFVFIG